MRHLIASAPAARRDAAAAEIGQQGSGDGRPRNVLTLDPDGPRFIGIAEDPAAPFRQPGRHHQRAGHRSDGGRSCRQTGDRYRRATTSHMVNLFNPQIIVLAGRVAGRLGEHLIRHSRTAAARYALDESREGAEIALCPVDAIR